MQMNGHASGAARQGSPIKAGAGRFDSPRRYSSPNRFKSPGKTGMDGMYGGHGTLLSNFSSAGVLCVWERSIETEREWEREERGVRVVCVWMTRLASSARHASRFGIQMGVPHSMLPSGARDVG